MSTTETVGGPTGGAVGGPTGGAVVGAGRARLLVAVAAVATLLGAALGFAVQPLVSRQLLPRLGGGAAVWNTTLVFFQATLLLGYLVTHLTSTRLSPRAQVVAHLAILGVGLLVLPVSVPASWSPPETGNPSWWLLGVLCLVVGPPYLAVATTGPLVQRWFSAGSHRSSSDPYFLYAISNVGSFAGLLAVPLWLDRSFSLGDQARWWMVAYVGFLVACVGVVALARPDRRRPVEPVQPVEPVAPAVAVERDGPVEPAGSAVAAEPTGSAVAAEPTGSAVAAEPTGPVAAARGGRWEWWSWAALAFVPSSLILGVTTHLTTDVASVPLMWVIPLGLYLLTYIIAFARRTVPVSLRRGLAGIGVAAAATATFVDYAGFPEKLVPHLAALFFTGLACHGHLADRRPSADRLTSFYVALSVGGVAGGAFNALLAPVLFRRVLEYPLMLTAAALLVGLPRGRRDWTLQLAAAVPVGIAAFVIVRRLSGHPARLALICALIMCVLMIRRLGVVGAVVIACVVAMGVRDATAAAIRYERGFYGAIRVEETIDEQGRPELHQLVHGTTIHGYQFVDPARRSTPTSYYGPTGPLGQLMTSVRSARGSLGRVGSVGLGVGTIASYLEGGDSLTYYEIDPLIVRIARDPSLFTYLRDAKGPVSVVLGDGRRRLETSTGRYEVLVLDAFSSDAIPVHLLTREAFETYRQRLAPGGLLAVHISNRYLDLEPVVAAIAADLGMAAVAGHHVATEEEEKAGTTGSDWIIVAEDRAALDVLRGSVWSPVRAEPGVRGWTDDRADLLSVLIT